MIDLSPTRRSTVQVLLSFTPRFSAVPPAIGKIPIGKIPAIATLATLALLFASTTAHTQTVLLREPFDDADIASRGWYDNTSPRISATEHRPGSTGSIEYRFLQGARTAVGGGALRHSIAATDAVYLSYWVKYSPNWTGSNKPYHPHEFHFVTNLENRWIGPARTHLTLYIEQNEGRPQLCIQDGLNVDERAIGQDLTKVTEMRAVAGCNGDSDGYGDGDCYQSGTVHQNGKLWRADGAYFADAPGPHYKSDWHHVEAYFKLNSIVDGKGVNDGIVRYWYDGVALIDHDDVVLRTGQHPTMKFNQFLIAPYIGDGSPVEQTMWVDDLTIATGRVASSVHESAATSVRMKITQPTPTHAEVRIALERAMPVTMKLVDLSGRHVATPIHRELSAGEHVLPIDVSPLASGVYLCVVETAIGTTTECVAVVW